MGVFLLIEYNQTELQSTNTEKSQVTITHDLIIIGSPPKTKAFAAEIMLKKLAKDWANEEFNTKLLLETHANIFNKIAKCYPRKDINGWGFEIDKLRQDQVESLFLKKIEYQEEKAIVVDCDLLEILKIKPGTIKPKPNSNEPSPPAPTSGDDDIDLLAALTNALESYQQALLVCNTLSWEEIYKFIEQLNELKRDPEERTKEWMADEFAKYKAKKGNSYARDVLGI